MPSIFRKRRASRKTALDLEDALLSAKSLYLSGKLQPAAAAYRAILDLYPENWESLSAAAAIELERGDRDGALALYDSFIDRCADHAQARYKRANVLNMLDRWDKALADYDRAVALDPNYANAYCNRGTALEHLARWDEALASFDRALAINPRDFLACYNRGSVLKELKRLEEALASYDQALALKSDYFEAYFNRGIVLQELRRYEEAATSYGHALELNPNHKYLLGIRRLAQMQICDWSNIESDMARLATGLNARLAVSPPLPILALFDSAPLHRLAAEIFSREEYGAITAQAPLPSSGRTDRIRIGYFSADFRNHPVSLLAAEMFEAHDRSRFETVAFAFGPESRDEVRVRLTKAFDKFIDVRERSDAEIASLARDLGIDIAVDLGGFTEHNRTQIFAHRAAPIQIAFLGYPGTMGSGFMDYLIADPTVVPLGSERNYSEQIIRLPSTFMPHDSKREIANVEFERRQLDLPARGFVFCCFNNSYKITPAIFDSWMRILLRVEEGVIWLSQSNSTVTHNLRREAVQRGVAAERLVFAPRVPSLPLHLARYRAADLFLDTLPYNAHATAIDALWAGLPVLTRAGETFAGRVAASLLTAIELPELICATTESYEDRAVYLAENPQQLLRIKEILQQDRLSKPIFDTGAYVRHLEAGYAQAYERYQASLPPAHLFVAP